MIALQKSLKINRTVVWLFVVAIVVEVINVIYCVSVSSSQVNACPRDPFPAQLSQALSIASCLLVMVAIVFAKQQKLITLSFALFHILVVGCLQLLLLSYANGGLNWCDVVF